MNPAERLAAIAARADAAQRGPIDVAAYALHYTVEVPRLVAFAQAVLALCDEDGNDDTAHILADVRRLADEHLGGAP